MQVTETQAEGLKREYKVIVQAGEIENRVTQRLDELRRTIRMPGFRPGKVPVALLRKQYGRSVMGEVLEQAVNQGSQQAISEHELRPALQPKIEVTSYPKIELTSLDEGTDLEFTMALEVLPEVPKLDLSGNQVVDISPLREMQRLTSLNFSGNRVREISILLNLRNLTIVRLDDNPLSEAARNFHIPALQDAGVVILGP